MGTRARQVAYSVGTVSGATALVLGASLVPAVTLVTLFWLLAGCRMGRDVYVNTLEVNDPYLVTIGDNSVIGLRVHLRRGTRVPPGTHILNPAGMDPHRVYELERGRGARGGDAWEK
jgi:acetyltransferase-like isoleucine patch superfamily enzyme